MREAREVETVALGGKPEHGSSSEVYMALACGCPVVPMQLPLTLSGGGKAGGRIEVEIGARETCCEIC